MSDFGFESVILEFNEEMDQREQLRRLVKWRTRRRIDRTAKLGDAVNRLMDEKIGPQVTRFDSVARVWSELVPVELGRHCRLAGISGGQLEVLVDSPSYANELKWCSAELLDQLQQGCPRAKIRKIKFTLG